jgi:DNA polymerase IIIc chi subunit
MSQEIIFYELENDLYKALALLLVRINNEGKRSLIFLQENIEELDLFLWSFGRNKFLPHATIFDKNPHRQPILLSNNNHNSNNADVLIFLQQPELDFIKQFNKVCYFFFSNNQKTTLQPNQHFCKKADKWHKLNIVSF